MGNCHVKRDIFNAVQAGDVASLRPLLAIIGPGGDLGFTQQPEGNSPLHVACICGHKDVVAELLAHGGAPVDARDAEGRTPLYVAAMGGHLECARLLLTTSSPDAPASSAGAGAGASVNLRSHAGLSALYVAAWRGHAEVVTLLRQHGADLSARDAEGQCAWDRAREWNHTALADRLEAEARASGWVPEKGAQADSNGGNAKDAQVAIAIESPESMQSALLPHAHQPAGIAVA